MSNEMAKRAEMEAKKFVGLEDNAHKSSSSSTLIDEPIADSRPLPSTEEEFDFDSADPFSSIPFKNFLTGPPVTEASTGVPARLQLNTFVTDDLKMLLQEQGITQTVTIGAHIPSGKDSSSSSSSGMVPTVEKTFTQEDFLAGAYWTLASGAGKQAWVADMNVKKPESCLILSVDAEAREVHCGYANINICAKSTVIEQSVDGEDWVSYYLSVLST